MFSGDREAIERIAYEFCEDKANNGVLYCETRYSPQLLANIEGIDDKEHKCTAREAVESVCNGLERGCLDFGVMVTSILCCMRHRPGMCLANTVDSIFACICTVIDHR